MKYRPHIYAKALAEVIATAKPAQGAAVVKNFLTLIRKNGDEAHLRKILEEAARITRAGIGIRKVTLETARKLGESQRATLKVFLKSGDVVEEWIDPSLVAGVRIVVDDERQFDGSLRGKLDKLFNTL